MGRDYEMSVKCAVDDVERYRYNELEVDSDFEVEWESSSSTKMLLFTVDRVV